MSKKGTNSIAKKQSKGQRRDELERKRDERSRRNALKKERKSKEYREDDENFASFSNQLESLGLKIKDIPGDGNCLFRALGDQLDGDHTTHAQHRRETVRYMRDHRADFEPFMEDNVSFNKHLEELSKLSTYGGNDSIVAFARNHGVDVVIHQLNEPRWVIQGSDCNKHGQVKVLHISYHNGEHYSSLRYIGDDGTEPAWMKHNQLTYFGAVESGKPTGKRKDRNPKEKAKKRGGEINTRTTNGEIPIISQGRSELTAEELVMTTTGCKDLALVLEALEENSYDVDAAINFILQLICVAEETGGASGESFNSTSTLLYNEPDHVPCETEKCVEMIEPIANNAFRQTASQEIKDETSACFGENGEELSDSRVQHNIETTLLDIQESTKDAHKSSMSESELEKRRDLTNRGTRPKVKTNNMQKPSNTHLSNKKRKELAKQEKKQRREERKKEEMNNVQEPSVTMEQSVTGVVADLGVLAI